ncbi:hypothetical protein [Polycladomyces abyssicola]|nr:hypothetical protein [Polycladomyces abyssicola]
MAVLMLSIILLMNLFPLTALAAGPEIHPPEITPPDIKAPTFTPPEVTNPEVNPQDSNHGNGSNPTPGTEGQPPNVHPWDVMKYTLKIALGGFLETMDSIFEKNGGNPQPKDVIWGTLTYGYSLYSGTSTVVPPPKDSYQFLLSNLTEAGKKIWNIGSYFKSPKEILQAIKNLKSVGGFGNLKNGGMMKFLNAITKVPKPLAKFTPALSIINGGVATVDMVKNLYQWGHTGDASKGWSALSNFGDVLTSAAPWVAVACPPAGAALAIGGTVLWAVGTYKANATNFKKGAKKLLNKGKELWNRGKSFIKGLFG